MKILKLVFGLSLAFCGGAAWSHDVPVHILITRAAAQTAYGNSLAFEDFLGTVSTGNGASDINYGLAESYLTAGSAYEDGPFTDPYNVPKEAGGYRSLNHFYDPLDTKYGKGLSDSPPDVRSVKGTNSFAWASVSNCMGVNLSINPHPVNLWSWQNARAFEWTGLTATNPADRETGLTNMFRAVGQVMHLLEDTSQPQHVRNEQHWDGLGPLFWESPIEDYGLAHKEELNYQHSMLDWRNAGFTNLQDFWDTGKYAALGVSALNGDTAGGAGTLGLAEWCNGNFLGDRHSYAEYFKPGDIRYYPYPARRSKTTAYTTFTDTLVKNGKTTTVAYLQKGGDGMPVTHHSALTKFGRKYPGINNRKASTIRDDNVLKDYHAAVIPRAVEYAAGLIDYYFRGDISGQVIDFDTNTMLYTISIQNVSDQEDFGGGTFYFYQQDSNDVRTLSGSTNLIQVLPNNVLSAGDSITVQVPGPLPIDGQFVCVYQGNIGANADGSAIDSVDANIAIAATTFNDRSITFDMTYDNPNAEVDFYLTDPCGVTHYEPDLYPNITSTCCKVVGGDNEDDSQEHQHMVVSDMQDGSYVLWVDYEGDDTNTVDCTLVTSSSSLGVLATNTFTLNTPTSGQYNQNVWPIGVIGPATVDTNGIPTTNNATWYVRKAVMMSNGQLTSW